MKKYHRIYHYKTAPIGEYCYAFDKLDGSNIRIEWQKKLSKKCNFNNGFGKFGTRNQMIKNVNDPFYPAIELFMEKYSENLNEIFRKDKFFRSIDKITLYCEYFGENSFAGWHSEKDEKNLILFDVELSKKGFIHPSDFLKIFKYIETPEVLYQGPFEEKFINKVRNNEYKLKEGVVCKGTKDNKVWMCKIKTNEWLDKLLDKSGHIALMEEFNGDESYIKNN